MLNLTDADIAALAAAAAAWHEATDPPVNTEDPERNAGDDLAELAERLVEQARRPVDTPTFPHAIVNPYQVVVYLDPTAPDFEHYPNGIPIACTAIEQAEGQFDVEHLTRAFPWWREVLLVERARDGGAAVVLARRKRDIRPATWRRPEPSGS